MPAVHGNRKSGAEVPAHPPLSQASTWRTIRIEWSPLPELFQRGLDPAQLFKELHESGAFRYERTSTSGSSIHMPSTSGMGSQSPRTIASGKGRGKHTPVKKDVGAGSSKTNGHKRPEDDFFEEF